MDTKSLVTKQVWTRELLMVALQDRLISATEFMEILRSLPSPQDEALAKRAARNLLAPQVIHREDALRHYQATKGTPHESGTLDGLGDILGDGGTLELTVNSGVWAAAFRFRQITYGASDRGQDGGTAEPVTSWSKALSFDEMLDDLLARGLFVDRLPQGYTIDVDVTSLDARNRKNGGDDGHLEKAKQALTAIAKNAKLRIRFRNDYESLELVHQKRAPLEKRFGEIVAKGSANWTDADVEEMNELRDAMEDADDLKYVTAT